MFAQNFFYYTFSIAIIAVAIFVCAAVIYWLVILKKFYTIVKRIDKTIELAKSKIKIFAWAELVSQAIKEIIEFIKEKRKK